MGVSCRRQAVVPPDESAPPLADELKLPPEDKEAAALAALEEFFMATDMISRAQTVRDGERVLPMMLDYHQTRARPLPSFRRASEGKEAVFDGVPMVFFKVESLTGKHYMVAVVWDGERFVVDWESLTAYGTMDWIDFLEEKPTLPQQMRVYLMEARGDPNFPAAPQHSSVVRIEHRDHPQPLIASVDTILADELAAMVEGQRVPVTLELAWRPIGPAGALVPVVVRMVAPGWSP